MSHSCLYDKGCEMGPLAYSPYPRRLESHLLMYLQRQHFLLSYFKTLSVGSFSSLLRKATRLKERLRYHLTNGGKLIQDSLKLDSRSDRTESLCVITGYGYSQ